MAEESKGGFAGAVIVVLFFFGILYMLVTGNEVDTTSCRNAGATNCAACCAKLGKKPTYRMPCECIEKR